MRNCSKNLLVISFGHDDYAASSCYAKFDYLIWDKRRHLSHTIWILACNHKTVLLIHLCLTVDLLLLLMVVFVFFVRATSVTPFLSQIGKTLIHFWYMVALIVIIYLLFNDKLLMRNVLDLRLIACQRNAEVLVDQIPLLEPFLSQMVLMGIAF